MSFIDSNAKHRALDCPRKKKVQNMFHTKTNIATTIVPKVPKLDNVPVNGLPLSPSTIKC